MTGPNNRIIHIGRYLGEKVYFVEYNLESSEPLEIQAERTVGGTLPGCFAIVISKQWRKALGATRIEPI